jgi:hypothetical protein
MALDEPKDSDDVFDIDGFTYIVDKAFMEQAKPVKIDFIDYGFKLTSSIQLSSGCDGCSCS